MNSVSFRRSAAIFVAAAFVVSRHTLACGPEFPNTIIDQGDKGLLTAPVADFAAEVARLRPLLNTNVIEEASSEKAELNDLREALAGKQPELLAQYKAIRKALAKYLADAQRPLDKAEVTEFPKLTIPEGLPAEFAEYLRGAIAWHDGKHDDARAAWQRILKLPDDQRRYRSTWAAYMLARSERDDHPELSAIHYQRVRDLARIGFRDSLHLAAASIGWEAQAELHRTNFTRAVELYLDQYQQGDATAIPSLQITAEKIFAAGTNALQIAARHKETRSLLITAIAANGGPHHGGPPARRASVFLAALEKQDLRELPGVDGIAWAAYQVGDFTAAQRWLDRAETNTATSSWLESKLLLRDGRLDEAATALSHAIENDWNGIAGGELATLRLARSQYTDALDLLLRSNYWTDAAYVAESVLTIGELTNFLKTFPSPPHPDLLPLEGGEGTHGNSFPLPSGEGQGEGRGAASTNVIAQLQHLTARRLVRLGKLDEAVPFMPEELRPRLTALRDALATGRDTGKPAADRAAALWEAAKLTREYGMNLMGTELDPDYVIWEGSYEAGLNFGERVDRRQHAHASADEYKRILEHASETKPATRFHYRYRAADLGWEAAELMPEDNDLTAQVLNESGQWIAKRDPQTADRFYKALVRRCGQTALGKEADKLRWFPAPPVKPQPEVADKPDAKVDPADVPDEGDESEAEDAERMQK